MRFPVAANSKDTHFSGWTAKAAAVPETRSRHFAGSRDPFLPIKISWGREPLFTA